jgi:5-amino-6-(5-phosphoribosylamino)uracil reductase
MHDRPYTLLSCSMSIDGYLDSAMPRRLELSNDADFDRVDAVRASCDAILVGAAAVRNDNPRLIVRSRFRRDDRMARGLPPSPIKVTVTERVELDADADFFTTGDTEKLVYCASPRVLAARSRLGPMATVLDGGQPVKMRRISEDLAARGVRRLMVEGGGKVHTQFLTDDLADELQLVVAQTLQALRASRVRLLSNNPDKARQLRRFGVAVTSLVPTGAHLSPSNARYLATKAGRGAHTLDVPLPAG